MTSEQQQPKTQITYQKHGLTPGDVHKTRTLQYADPQGEGADRVWDYSGIPFANDEVFVETLSAGTEEGKNIAAGNAYGTAFSFNVTPQSNEFWGHKHSNYVEELTQPIVKTRFPQSYLDQHSGTYEGTIKVEYGGGCSCGVWSGSIGGTYSTAVDAYGTIVLPNGNKFTDVLRVKTTETHTIAGQSGELEIVKYLWYTDLLRYPIFVTHIYRNRASDGAVSEQKSSHVSVAALEYTAPAEKAAPASPSVLAENLAYDVYPNPVENETYVTYTLVQPAKVSVKVFDVYGKCVQTFVDNELQGEGNYKYLYAPAISGVYFVTLETDGVRYSRQVVKN